MSTQNLRFKQKIIKITHTPVYPTFHYKVGFAGFKLYGHVNTMSRAETFHVHCVLLSTNRSPVIFPDHLGMLLLTCLPLQTTFQ